MNKPLANHALVGLLLATSLGACASWKPLVHDMLTAADIACIVAHGDVDDVAVRRICGLTDALVLAMKRVLAEERGASPKACLTEGVLCTIQ